MWINTRNFKVLKSCHAGCTNFSACATTGGRAEAGCMAWAIRIGQCSRTTLRTWHQLRHFFLLPLTLRNFFCWITEGQWVFWSNLNTGRRCAVTTRWVWHKVETACHWINRWRLQALMTAGAGPPRKRQWVSTWPFFEIDSTMNTISTTSQLGILSLSCMLFC